MKLFFANLAVLFSLTTAVNALRGAERSDEQRKLNTGGTWNTVLETSFEEGTGGFELSGSNAVVHEIGTGNAHDGSKAMKLSNSGAEAIMTSESIDISAYDRVEASFYYRGENLEDGDGFVMEFQNDGAGPWRVAKTFVQDASSGKDMIGVWTHQRLQWLAHDGIQNINNVRVRFQASGNAADDTFLIDSFSLLGRERQVPTAAPTAQPTVAPTPQPTVQPTAAPTRQPSVHPTPIPTPQPTVQPTVQPTPIPTAQPTTQPTPNPTPSMCLAEGTTCNQEADSCCGVCTKFGRGRNKYFECVGGVADPTPAPTPNPTANPTPNPTPAPTPQGQTPAPTFMPTPLPTSAPVSCTLGEAGSVCKKGSECCSGVCGNKKRGTGQCT